MKTYISGLVLCLFMGIQISFTRAKSAIRKAKSYLVRMAQNGFVYVDRFTVGSVFHATVGNAKTGRVGNYNLPIEYTCKHDCECYMKRNCYACQGCYCFHDNQAQYSENLNFLLNSDDATFISYVLWFIHAEKLTKFRYFTCGDIPSLRFIRLICDIARKAPHVEFWLYTKKYELVNHYCDMYGLDSIPANLCVIFSHWMNEDGTYYPMNNPYNFPTSEFIPMGKENEIKVNHICPCSNPDSVETCADCKTPCYRLKHGESMGLMEHSTPRTKARDKALHVAKKALKK